MELINFYFTIVNKWYQWCCSEKSIHNENYYNPNNDQLYLNYKKKFIQSIPIEAFTEELCYGILRESSELKYSMPIEIIHKFKL